MACSRKHVLSVDVNPRRGRGNFRGHVPPYYKLLQGECVVSCRKTADPNDMRFGTKTWVGPKNHVWNEGPHPHSPREKGNFVGLPKQAEKNESQRKRGFIVSEISATVWPIFAKFGTKMRLLTTPIVKTVNFYNPRWLMAAILKTVRLPYLRNRSTNLMKFGTVTHICPLEGTDR